LSAFAALPALTALPIGGAQKAQGSLRLLARSVVPWLSAIVYWLFAAGAQGWMSMTVTVPSVLFDTYANLPFGAIAIPVGLTPTLTVGPAGRPVPVEIETTVPGIFGPFPGSTR